MIGKVDYKEHTWKRAFSAAKRRCEKHPHYVKKGIQFRITKEEFRYIWFRDKGYLLKYPSIDRIDNNGDYVLENCRYIETGENARKDKKGRPVLQFTKDLVFIRRWDSASKAESELKLQKGHIWRTLRGVCCTSGFLFVYEDKYLLEQTKSKN